MLGRMLVIVLACGAAACAARAEPFSETEAAAVDALATRALAASDAPSASIAIVRDGELVFAKAYGERSLAPPVPARADDRYEIGSITKQFTAATILLLAQDGRLSLDDKVSRFLPGLTAADRISLRQLLSHTSGYQSYFTLEVTPVEAFTPISPQAIAERWGRAPLDFEPGTQWSYSNTGYTIAGLVAERAAGVSLAEQLQSRIFAPLGMASAGDVDLRPLSPSDARGYTRFLDGPPREARRVAAGWGFAAGKLAMTASDLARWDIAMIDHRLLPASAWAEQQTDTKLTDGAETGYGLGVYVDSVRGVRRIHHDGSTEGFLSENRVYPDARAAVVVLVNADYDNAQSQIARGIETLLFPAAPTGPVALNAPAPTPEGADQPVAAEDLALAKSIVRQVRTGTLDRSRLSDDANGYFTAAALADYRQTLSRLGEPQSFTQQQRERIGGLEATIYKISWPNRKLIAVMRVRPGGKVASFVMFPP